jgi:hypothetical protein
MKKFVKEIISDTAVLSMLIILPLAFLGPGWRTNTSAKSRHGPFRDQHKSVSGETAQEDSEQQQQQQQYERDIPILRAFEVEREACRGDDKRYR